MMVTRLFKEDGAYIKEGTCSHLVIDAAQST